MNIKKIKIYYLKLIEKLDIFSLKNFYFYKVH
jgi:hypothetical protein